MVEQNIVKFVGSGGFSNTDLQLSLGGLPSHRDECIISSDTPLNLFDHVDLARATAGEYQYLCIYAFGTETEIGSSVRFWFDRDTLSDENEFSWGFETPANAHRYQYEPHKWFDNTFIDIADTAALDLVQFSVSCWFRTSEDFSAVGRNSEGLMINKGGLGSSSAGENMNYCLFIGGGGSADNKLRGGFETTAGTAYYATSTNVVNDGNWHHGVVTYDGANVRLYVDGVAQTPVAIAATPETNLKPLTIAKNSRAADRYYKGDLDEIYVWNNDLTAGEVTALYNSGTIPQEAAIVYKNKFGEDNGSLIAQIIPNINTAPTGVTFQGQGTMPEDSNIEFNNIPFKFLIYDGVGGNANGDAYFPVWVRRRILPNSKDSVNNKGYWKLAVDLTRENTPQGGDEGGGGGTGGSDLPHPVTACNIFSTGDTDCNGVTDDMFDEIKKIDSTPDAILICGDVQYTSDPKCFFDRTKDLDKVILPMMGNHDKWSWYSGHYNLPKSYYTKVIQNIGIVCMDSEMSFSVGSSQHTFVIDALKKFFDNSAIDWIIVAIHRPFYSAQSNHDDNEGNKTVIYMPEFDKYKVDFICQAHNHNAQRSRPLKYKSGNTPTVTNNSDDTYKKGDGRIVITNGTGGHDDDGDLYSIDHASYNVYENDNETVAFVLQFSGTNNKDCIGRFYNLSHEVVDEFLVTT